jgi:hypothetical protein
MKTTGVLPEALAASISWFSRSEMDTMTNSLRPVEAADPIDGRERVDPVDHRHVAARHAAGLSHPPMINSEETGG